MRLELDSPAKLNLFLQVTARRPDGYHELRTLFWPLPTLCDRVTVEFGAQRGVRCRCDDPNLPVDSDNLAGRAALAYAEAAHIVPDWDITIAKRIPAAAGLGGGSSDAAAVLRLLDRRFGALDRAALGEAALKIGADVPYFLDPRPAVATGVGEKLAWFEPEFRLPPLLVLFPGFPVTAKWAYTHLAPEHIGGSATELDALLADLKNGDTAGFGKRLYNALGFALFAKFPLLEVIRSTALEAGAAGVEVTGSGSALFAVAPDAATLENVAAALCDRLPTLRQFKII